GPRRRGDVGGQDGLALRLRVEFDVPAVDGAGQAPGPGGHADVPDLEAEADRVADARVLPARGVALHVLEPNLARGRADDHLVARHDAGALRAPVRRVARLVQDEAGLPTHRGCGRGGDDAAVGDDQLARGVHHVPDVVGGDVPVTGARGEVDGRAAVPRRL